MKYMRADKSTIPTLSMDGNEAITTLNAYISASHCHPLMTQFHYSVAYSAPVECKNWLGKHLKCNHHNQRVVKCIYMHMWTVQCTIARIFCAMKM